jgi:hypothetical protein
MKIGNNNKDKITLSRYDISMVMNNYATLYTVSCVFLVACQLLYRQQKRQK